MPLVWYHPKENKAVISHLMPWNLPFFFLIIAKMQMTVCRVMEAMICKIRLKILN